MIDQLGAVVDRLFAAFIKVRLDPGWETDTLPRLTRWVAGRD
jgi:hypothetical protein